MPTKEITKRVWFTISFADLIDKLQIPGLTPTFVPELCRLSPQKVTDVALSLAREEIQKNGASVVAIAGFLPILKTEQDIDCVVLLGGDSEELKKVIGFGKPFDWIEKELEQEELTQYQKIKESAFNLMRKSKITSLSEDALWDVFKYSRHSSLYILVVQREIKDGLTISKLYDQDRSRGLER